MNAFIRYIFVYFRDSDIRFNVAVLLGLVINSFYIIFNLIIGILYANPWSVAIAAYYILIAVFRYLLIGDTDGQKEAARAVSAIMTVLSFVMLGIMVYTSLGGANKSYPSAVLPIFAAYACISIARALFGLFIRDLDSSCPRRTAHAIRLSNALLSLFNLQTSLFAYIGISSGLSVLLNTLTAAVASISMFVLARRE